MARHRLLVALIPPEPLALEVEGLRAALGDPAQRRIPPHVTVLPPVNVPEAALDEVLAALRSAAARCGPLDLVLGPLGNFLPKPPVLFLIAGGVAGNVPPDDLLRLREELQTSPLGREDRRDFVPHLTVASRFPTESIPEVTSAVAFFDRPWRCDTVHLLHQVPRATGTRWELLADAPLGEPPRTIGTGGREVELATSQRIGPDLAAATSLRPAPPAGTDEPCWWTPERRQLVVTARRGGEVLGGVVVDLGPWRAGRPSTWDRVRLLGIEVVSHERREGVGRHLVRHAEALLARRGWSWAEAEAADPATAALLAGLGWSESPISDPGTLIRRLPHEA